ncbi:hypothetical protein [Paraflavitalea speifideaquila]|uniref:hypothetical protein n=1 Tax=Paraflavitalea speifideaquila TaxID=3076558 RepID=UPI0028E7276F|nr:hypothetical protein [Paraflavitalea speifideiaquila]
MITINLNMKKLTLITAMLGIVLVNGFGQVTVQSGASVHIQNGANITIEGELTLANGSNLANNGIISIGNSSGLAADFTDNTITAYHYGSGQFIFNSTTNQLIKCANTFERIDVDAGSLTLASNIIANKWYLIKGIIHTASFIAIAAATLNWP